MTLARQTGSDGKQEFFVVRSDDKGCIRAKGAEVLEECFAARGRFRSPTLPTPLNGSMTQDLPPPGDPAGTLEGLAELAGGARLLRRCSDDGLEVFIQKTRPVYLHNLACVPLKASLHAEDDRICAVPLGKNVGGDPAAVTLQPKEKASLHPPGRAEKFQLKVVAPGLVEKKLYTAFVRREQLVQLWSTDCSQSSHKDDIV